LTSTSITSALAILPLGHWVVLLEESPLDNFEKAAVFVKIYWRLQNMLFLVVLSRLSRFRRKHVRGRLRTNVRKQLGRFCLRAQCSALEPKRNDGSCMFHAIAIRKSKDNLQGFSFKYQQG
jgi:hypothetical protein